MSVLFSVRVNNYYRRPEIHFPFHLSTSVSGNEFRLIVALKMKPFLCYVLNGTGKPEVFTHYGF